MVAAKGLHQFPQSLICRIADVGGRELRLAAEKPLLDLAAELGYPNLEALCVAVADHAIAADEIADKLIEQVDGAALKAASMAARSRRTA